MVLDTKYNRRKFRNMLGVNFTSDISEVTSKPELVATYKDFEEFALRVKGKSLTISSVQPYFNEWVDPKVVEWVYTVLDKGTTVWTAFSDLKPDAPIEDQINI